MIIAVAGKYSAPTEAESQANFDAMSDAAAANATILLPTANPSIIPSRRFRETYEMGMTFTFHGKYLLLTIILFFVEVWIALFVADALVRPFIGDALVVILIYCFFRIFLNVSDRKLAFGVLLFACAIEILQYFDYVKLLGLENNRVISVILGRTFEWLDFAAYLTGFLIILAAEKIVQNREEI